MCCQRSTGNPPKAAIGMRGYPQWAADIIKHQTYHSYNPEADYKKGRILPLRCGLLLPSTVEPSAL
jgi:hypothetical protein